MMMMAVTERRSHSTVDDDEHCAFEGLQSHHSLLHHETVCMEAPRLELVLVLMSQVQ